MAASFNSPDFAVFASNMTDFAADLAGNVVNAISSMKSNMTTTLMASNISVETITRGYNWTAYASLLLASTYIFEFGARKYRDIKLHDHGSPAPVVSFKLPFGQSHPEPVVLVIQYSPHMRFQESILPYTLCIDSSDLNSLNLSMVGSRLCRGIRLRLACLAQACSSPTNLPTSGRSCLQG